MNLHGQINAACESRPGHPQPCHWSVLDSTRVWLSCLASYKMDFSSCDIMPGFGKSSHILQFASFLKGKDMHHSIFISSYNNHLATLFKMP